MKVIVRGRIKHGVHVLENGKKVFEGNSDTPKTTIITVEPSDKVYDTDKDEPFKSHFTPAEIMALVVARAPTLDLATEPPGPPPAPPPPPITEADVVRIVHEELAKITAPAKGK